MAVNIYRKSRPKRFEIGLLVGQGFTLEQAEDMALKGDTNKTKSIQRWRAAGLYPYGDIDTPDADEVQIHPTLHSAIHPAIQSVIHSANTVESPTHNPTDEVQIHPAHDMNPKVKLQSANTLQFNWNDPTFVVGIKTLIKEVIEEQSSAMQSAMQEEGPAAMHPAMNPAHAHTEIKPSLKLWRTMQNCSPVSLRIQTELLTRARVELKNKYHGQMSLNHFIELCLWQLIGSPQDLLEPEA